MRINLRATTLLLVLALVILPAGMTLAADTFRLDAPLTTSRTADPALAPGSALQQFISGGHVLGFGPAGYVVSNGSYALKVDFAGAARVEPVAVGGATGAGSGKAAPLGRVRYRELWPGITAEYDAPAGAIVRSTWRLAAGADPRAIRLHYNRGGRTGLNPVRPRTRVKFESQYFG